MQGKELQSTSGGADLYDPRDPATVDDPFAAFRRLRDEAPVYRLRNEPFWVLSRFADVEAAMFDWKTFSSAKGNLIYEDPARVGRTMATCDPPRHDAMRRSIGTGYTPKRVRAHEQRIAQLVDDLLDRIDPAGFDFVTQFAAPLTGGVIGSLIGVPVESLEELRVAVDEGLAPTDEFPDGRGLGEVFAFMRDLVADRRRNPRDDMLTDFLKAEENGVSVDDEDIAVTCGSILGAGFSSTAHQMSNIMLSLYRAPDQRRLVLEDPSLIPQMIEEGVRHDVSTMAFGRQTTRDVELHGVTIPADSRVMILLSSANHDERHFHNPDAFLVRREAQRHMGFSTGVHHCMGSSLARLEMRIAFEQILARFGEFELDLGAANRLHSLNFRGFRTLPLCAQHYREPRS
ncbi:cytochrome P450 [Sphingobium sp.]|uniref:cytochrome P450 n=1 Tax=Sphingobium sp. TaxID=1912891 RepID=UPI0028BE4EB2|nr:cytochrome P450 [Sphingobium sp.]